MTIYCLYVFDRHCNCVYYHDWHRTNRPKRAVEGGGLLSAVSHALSPLPPSAPAQGSSAPSTPFTSPRNTLTSTSGVLVALSHSHQSQGTVAAGGGGGGTGLPFDEEAKLVYGVILSLRNMIKRLSGRDESFVSYRTSTYKLHFFETVSGYRTVVRNPLVPMDSRERGVDNEYFRASVDRLVRGLSVFQ
ncbi:TRAPP complex subunit bet5 [Lactarius sanguifluus]|nr:TRAPP complex subunit bet5 [Lactarius sanguifluus]